MPYVRTRLGRWFYDERGSCRRAEDPVIVLWPSLLFDGGLWREQVEPLAALGRVVVLDPPGHGKSEVPPPFSLEDNTDALLDVFGDLRIGRAIFIGLSWGGMLGMRMALQHSSRIRALALFDTSAEVERRVARLRYRVLVSFGRRFGLPPGITAARIAPLFFTDRTRRDRPELVERFVRKLNGFPREGTARAVLAILHRKDILPRLRDIRVPTLVACGTEDRALVPVHSERIAAHVPNARLAWIAGAGHASVLEQPQAANEALVPFVRDALA
jgi:3-oxoadipate enol-lactonase